MGRGGREAEEGAKRRAVRGCCREEPVLHAQEAGKDCEIGGGEADAGGDGVEFEFRAAALGDE